MDIIAYILIIAAGVVPPAVVGWWAYRQGLAGRQEALALRDEALQQVHSLRTDILNVEARLKAGYPTIPPIPTPKDIADALKPTLDTIDARVERHMDDIRAEMPEVKDIIAAMPPYPTIPTTADITAAVTGAVNGAIGRLIQQGTAAGKEEMAVIEGAIPPAERVVNAILGAITRRIAGD